METRYQAFISYSHKDAYWADWLHRSLERFRIPAKIISDLGLPSNNLRPIFKDHEDLGAATDLSEAIHSALNQSKALIIVCSPNAKASSWVNKEVSEYIKIHGTNRIYCLQVDGQHTTGLPQVLIDANVEPLAIDIKYGKRIALLKIIAGLLDIDFDHIQQRELHQRHSRFAWVIAASLAGMLLTSSLAWHAVLSKQEADVARIEASLRRTQAEELIDFMLGDLRQKLEPIGRLDLLEDVGKNATRYFSTLEDTEVSIDDRLRRARSMRQIGDVRFKAGDFAGAVEAFDLALSEISKLHTNTPNDSQLIFELSQAHYWVGFSHWYKKDLINATKHWEQYLHHASTLVNTEPDNIAWGAEYGWALSNLGTLEIDRQNFPKAYKYFVHSTNIFEELYRKTNDLQYHYEMSSSLSWIGDTLKNQGLLNDALKTFLRETNILSSILNNREHANANWQYSYVTALRHLGELQLDTGDLASSQQSLNKALKKLSELRILDGRNTHWQYGECVIQNLLAKNALYSNNPKVQYHLQKAEASIKALLPIEPNNKRWQLLELDIMVNRAITVNSDKTINTIATIMNKAETIDQTTSLPSIKTLLLKSFGEVDQEKRVQLASKAEQIILEKYAGINSPDVLVSLIRSKYLRGEKPSKLLADYKSYFDNGLMHPALPDMLISKITQR